MNHSIGIDVGATHIKGILISDNGKIIAQEIVGTEDGEEADGSNWKAVAKGLVKHLKKKAGKKLSIGIAAPGIANVENSAIAFMPGRMGGIENFVWANFLKEEKVIVLNDAHAALVAEASLGVGKGIDNIVLLTLGTGVGGGLWINGQLFQGFLQRAGHLGHVPIDSESDLRSITGMPGSLEEAMGEVSLTRRSLGKFHSTKELVKAYEGGDTFATYVWLNSVRKLAIAIAGLINTFSPGVIILSGGITKAKKSLFNPLSDFLELYEWRIGGQDTQILRAKFGQYAGAIGAAVHARETYS